MEAPPAGSCSLLSSHDHAWEDVRCLYTTKAGTYCLDCSHLSIWQGCSCLEA